jgi:hypothetical protein
MFFTVSEITWYSSTGIRPCGFGRRAESPTDALRADGVPPPFAAGAANAPEVCAVAPLAASSVEEERSPQPETRAAAVTNAATILLRIEDNSLVGYGTPAREPE